MNRTRKTAAPGPIPVPLIVRSAHSLGMGTAPPGTLVERAREQGLDAIALTDRDNLYGAVVFLRAAAQAGIRPVLGAEVTVRAGMPQVPGEDGARGFARGAARASGSVILLVREAAGYASLCRILTARHLAPTFDLAERVGDHAEGLEVLVRDAATLERLRDRVPRERLHAAVIRPTPDRGGEAALRATAQRLGAGLVGTVDAFIADPADRPTHRLLAAVRENELITRLDPDRLAPDGAHLAGPAETFRLFADDPALLAASRRLALGCSFNAGDLPAPGSLFPKLPLPDGESAYDRLYRMTQDGLRRRYLRVTREVARRLATELEQIDAMGFTDYFVVVGDIVAAARARGIPTVGRGSGASSIVSYLLGITNVDPVRYRLTFERFLHRLRRDLPDLDIDLCWRRRDEVIRHVYETYGADRVAMISTHNRYQARGAFREAAKAFGLAPEMADRIAGAIPSFSEGPLASAIASTPLGRTLDLGQAPLPELIAAADRLIGLPHTLGIHCGGIVIGPGPLDTWVPLEMATKGIVVTQYEMNAIEAIGLVKIDLLGNRAISTIAETIVGIRSAGEAAPDIDALPEPDRLTSALLEQGETLGCFQIESPGMRNLLRMLRTRDLEGTINALSLIRPGPAGSGMKERFVRRERGLEADSFLHASLAPLLASTHGILLYEEDVICVAAAIGGFDRAVGDLLRRAVASASRVTADPSLGERPSAGRETTREDPWRDLTMRGLENRFIACAVRNGVDSDIARQVWQELARFGSYAFCKAHASGYGVLAYITTYLKAHHAGPFYAALLNNHQGMYPLRVHVEEARRRGVPLAAPCVHRSASGWTWDGSFLRCGLAQVRGLSDAAREAILRERDRGAFADVEEFVARTGVSLPEAEALILSGALDEIGPGPRPARLWRLHCRARRRIDRGEDASMRLGLPARGAKGAWQEYDRETRVRHELQTLDIAITAHPVEVIRERLAREGGLPVALPAACLVREGPGSALGMLAAARRVRTKRGDRMLFLTLEDESGLVECTLFPPVYERFGTAVRGGWLLHARGTIEAPFGAPTLTVDRLASVSPIA